MKKTLILMSFAFSAAQTWGQTIAVPTFGPIGGNSSDIDYTSGQSFGQGNGWTVTGSGSSVDLIGGLWQSPDGLQSVDMDGYTVGQIATTITVPTAGNVIIDFWLSGNYGGAPATKTLGVTLGLSQQQVTFTLDGNNAANMKWTTVSMVFDNQAAGQESLTFTSLDGPLGSPEYAFGPAIGTVTADEVPEPSIPAFFGIGGAGLAWLRRRTQ